MITQKEFNLISECYAYHDKAVLRAAKKYTDNRMDAEIAALVRRLDALEAAAASSLGRTSTQPRG